MELFLARVAYSNLDDKKVTESYRYYIIGLTDGKGKTTSRRVLIKELSAMEACNTISDSWENVVTSVRLLDVVTVIR